uniref:ATP synthase complex subunit 8 n=1 Tax=Acraea rogersi TaxID=1777088 RepID=A0A140CV70_9NEOP|nr:ATP synthase F0 subunit 8 [Acraea rogersi]AMJ17194.1 ATP synthase F0 subunit 8 [Acraea rogersi]
MPQMMPINWIFFFFFFICIFIMFMIMNYFIINLNINSLKNNKMLIKKKNIWKW